ncbi:MAG: hypothetical protein WDA24_08600 [Tissierellales bacterium]
MKHSLIYRFVSKLINNIIEYYRYSTIKKIIDIIIVKIKIVFGESLFFKALARNDNSFKSKRSSFIIKALEVIINWIIKTINTFVSKGLKGSIVVGLFNSVQKVIKERKSFFVMNVIVSAVIIFDIYAIIIGAFTLKKLIFTLGVMTLFVLNCCTDILTAFKESFVRKSIDKIFEFNIEE